MGERMEISRRENAASFASLQGFGDIHAKPPERAGTRLRQYVFESDDRTRSLFPLSRLVCDASQVDGTALGVVNDTMVWASGRDEFLIESVLRSCFGDRWVDFGDGAAFSWQTDEVDAATSLVHLAMIFGWDLHLFRPGAGLVAFVSHDGYFVLKDPGQEIDRRFLELTGARA